jgi:cytochrome c biogenesis protein CcmG/thiol:disulfide interchange protein DsbE
MTTTSSRSKRRRSSTRSRRRGRGRRSRRSNLWVWVFLGVLVVLFGVLAFVSRSTGPAAEITEATPSGEALPPLAQGGSDPAVGSDAPELTGQTLDGEAMTIEPGDGTPKAIVFLAHWCPHCQREVPVVTQWVEDGQLPEGVELVGVTTGIDRNRPNFPPQDWLEREAWPADTMVDGNNAAAGAYGLTNYPYWVLVDGDGQVVLRWSGETTPQQLTERIGGLAE